MADLTAYDRRNFRQLAGLARQLGEDGMAVNIERAADAMERAAAALDANEIVLRMAEKALLIKDAEIARLTRLVDGLQLALNLANTERVRCVNAAWNEAIEAAANKAASEFYNFAAKAIRQLKREGAP